MEETNQETNQAQTTQTPQTPQTLPQVTTVTKHPGRVEAGKRVAEWNRQKRLSNQAKQKILSGEEEHTPVETPKTTTTTTTTNSQSYLMNVIMGVGGAGIGAYIVYKVLNKPPPPPPSPPPKSTTTKQTEGQKTQQVQVQCKQPNNNDPFKME